jgi:hypothetical protein
LSKRPAGALAGIAIILFLATPAPGAMTPRDSVIVTPSPGSASISASAWSNRYAINDGSGETVAIAVTAACQVSCNASNPQGIANFLGTLIHGSEMSSLEVQLDTPSQIAYDCGFGAQACYFAGEDRIVIGGDNTPGRDGASREFILAHEYGHHVAHHRESPPPFPAPIDWGTARWSSHEGICRLRRSRLVFPGSLGLHYYRDPGEAFAEAFAFNRFPESGLRWRWLRALQPDAAAFRAIRADTLDPWLGRTPLQLSGRVPPRRRGAKVETFRTPLDGTVSLRPADPRLYDLSLIGPAGRRLRGAGHGLGPGRPINFTVCGQSRLRVAIRSSARTGGAFRLQVQRP